MRIISGRHKGKRIQAPKNLPVRPTTDMAKEALFNILNNYYYLDSISVLDLFSGTGNISYEFASRGTEKIIAVDGNYKCIKFINETNNKLDFPIVTIKNDVYSFLEKTKLQFDVVFADPPYDFSQEQFVKIVDIVFDKKILSDNGILVIEHSSQTDISNHPNFTNRKKYGGNFFSFFE